MPSSPAALITEQYCQTHQIILAFVGKLTDDQLRWQLPAGSLSIAFHVWHLARWADGLQAALPGMTPELNRLGASAQLWYDQGLAAAWGFEAALGFDETGMGMPDDVALRLPFPPKELLLGYVRGAFALADERIASLSDAEFQSVEQRQDMTAGIFGESTVGAAVMSHLTHDNRHLGMMEALLGLQGQKGSATR